jgi:hypothetical protein
MIKLLTNRLKCDTVKLTDAERVGFDASVCRSLCKISKELNEEEK